MFEVHTSERPVRVESYIVAVEIANNFKRDYGIVVAITRSRRRTPKSDGGPCNAGVGGVGGSGVLGGVVGVLGGVRPCCALGLTFLFIIIANKKI